MGDLISRSTLLNKIDEDIKSTEKWMKKIESDIHNKRYDILNSQLNTLKTYRLIIEEQPTAYDVDGVIKGLEKYRNFITIQARGFVQTAINIVKDGGIND